MRIHYLQHVRFEGLGSIEAWVYEQGHALSVARMFDRDPLPRMSQFDWLIVMGGPMGVHDETEHPWLVDEKRCIEEAIRSGKTVLGICLGAQLIANVLGARVTPNAYKEIGWFPIELTSAAATSAIFGGFPAEFEVFHWHGDTFEIPAGAVHLARSEACEHQAYAYGDRVLGLQFHLETTLEQAAQFVNEADDELVEAPFVQGPEQIVASPARFAQINRHMRTILERLESITENPR